MISFADGDALLSPVTFAWNAWTSPPAAGMIWFGLHNMNTDQELEQLLAASETEPDSSQILASDPWELGISFEVSYSSQNANGISILASKWVASLYDFTVVDP